MTLNKQLVSSVLKKQYRKTLFSCLVLAMLLGTGCTGSTITSDSTSPPPDQSALDLSVTSEVMQQHRREPIRPLSNPHGLSSEKVELGRELFHDVRLSADNSISCASCHNVKEGGDDGLPTSVGINGQVGGLNAPTVLNSSKSLAQFWDGRAKDLREQAGGPIHNPIEMGSNWSEVISKLNQDTEFIRQFEKVYPHGLNEESIADAIATYETALVTVNSPFDRYLMGDDSALSEEALEGYKLFKAIGCISCHQGQAVGGNMFQKFGVMGDFSAQFDSSSQVSRGRMNATNRTVDLHRFKVPSLRTVHRTAPYFHNGCTDNLESAIKIMAEFQLGESLDDVEVNQIKAFLISLDGQIAEELE